jgi:hypothetical protein
MRFIAALILILVATTAQAKETVTVGLASNFSELSTVSFNPFGGYFQNAIELAVSDNKALLDRAGINL